jgi:hypothetical protein
MHHAVILVAALCKFWFDMTTQLLGVWQRSPCVRVNSSAEMKWLYL